jgi:branched-chain amino acid transport system substrate-binding protein
MRRLLGILPSLALAACSDVTGPRYDTIVRIGAVETLKAPDGMPDANGTSIQKAVNLAVTEINAAGGVLGKQLVVIHADDAGDPVKGAAQCALLVQRGIAGLVAGASSGASTNPAALKVPILLQSSAPAPSTKDNLLRTVPADTLEARVLGERAAASGADEVSVVFSDSYWGKEMRSAFVAALGSERVAGEVALPSGGLPFSHEARLVLADRPDAIALFAGVEEAAAIAKELGARTSSTARRPIFFLPGRLKTQAFLDGMGSAGALVEGAIGAARGPSADEADRARRAAFDTAYTAKYASDPGLYSDAAYDAVHLLATAIEESGVEDPAAILEALSGADPADLEFGPGEWASARAAFDQDRAVSYRGASGRLELDDLGELGGYYSIWSIRDGALTELEVVEMSTK